MHQKCTVYFLLQEDSVVDEVKSKLKMKKLTENEQLKQFSMFSLLVLSLWHQAVTQSEQ